MKVAMAVAKGATAEVTVAMAATRTSPAMALTRYQPYPVRMLSNGSETHEAGTLSSLLHRCPSLGDLLSPLSFRWDWIRVQ